MRLLLFLYGGVTTGLLVAALTKGRIKSKATTVIFLLAALLFFVVGSFWFGQYCARQTMTAYYGGCVSVEMVDILKEIRSGDVETGTQLLEMHLDCHLAEHVGSLNWVSRFFLSAHGYLEPMKRAMCRVAEYRKQFPTTKTWREIRVPFDKGVLIYFAGGVVLGMLVVVLVSRQGRISTPFGN